MEGDQYGGIGGTVEGSALKPATPMDVEVEVEDCNSSSVDESPPAMIIVETCITPKDSEASTVDATEEASCSLTLVLKPNMELQSLPQSVAANGDTANQSPQTEAEAEATPNNSSAPDEIAKATPSGSNNELAMGAAGVGKLQRCCDGATQCNNLHIDYCEATNSSDSMPSIGSLVCRICHNADNPEQLVSPCLCKGSLTYVHVQCLERWISTSRCTICELCQFQYNTEQTLRYTCLQSLRMWYGRAMSRRALQEDCQMFSLLTLVAFGIIGTLLVGIQYYALNTQSWGLSKLWTRSWMLFFLLMTVTVYFANVYMLIKSQLTPWYRWWQSARDIKLILENRRPFAQPQPQSLPALNLDEASTSASMFTHHDRRSLEVTYHTPSSSIGSLNRAAAAAAASIASPLPDAAPMKLLLPSDASNALTLLEHQLTAAARGTAGGEVAAHAAEETVEAPAEAEDSNGNGHDQPES